MHFVVKLFPEIIIKSPPVRKRFIKQLRANLRRVIKGRGHSAEVRNEWDKVEVLIPSGDQECAEAVKRILATTPGIANFSEVTQHPLGDFDQIADLLWADYGQSLSHKTFCVRVKRTGKHDFKSVDAEREIGGRLLQRAESATVRLNDPNIKIRLEIRGDQLYILEQTTQGLGGFPLGTQEAVMSLISGGFDSTVASYLTMKRGLRTHFCFFNLGGRAHELGVKEVAWYLWDKYGSSHRVKFITVPFEDVVTEILTKVDNSQMGVVLKRMMYRAATEVANAWNVNALVTGECVAQVSSQTLPNLAVIDSVTDMLTIRPLITMDKNDIINIARNIGTEDFAANMPEYCGVISVKPTTRAKPERIKREEENFDFAVLEKAIENRREENIDEMMADLVELPTVETFSSPQPAMTILDIRHPDEVMRKPLKVGAAEVATAPFFSLQKNFKTLDQDKHYLLYCDHGVMSKLHAELLHEQGFENLGLYLPRV
ncbi:MAG: tRNA 4-thiouridine(8) synthase ThiI [Gammaproteobacteria bacterium]|nr:MAG: tRNA 4-thiouridine(8) synthase ThiI [Gammaproteobacteria bacterium]RLA52751.1 MAG: tRNA 4-thiouridine(8) synthase ThiI [Gammaproteobacteria bacterium]